MSAPSAQAPAGPGVASRALALLVALAIALLAVSMPRPARAEEPALVSAQGAVVLDEAGNVLYELNGDVRYPPASITKVMTAIVALDSGVPLDTVVTLRKIDFPKYPYAQLANLPEGGQLTLRELMEVMLVYSANDCALMVGETVAGSEQAFCDLMNEKCAELGMDGTHFENTHGLEAEGHVATPRDIATMGHYALTHYPFIAKWVRTESVTVNVKGEDFTFKSTDVLLGDYPGAMGIKTGSVDAGVTFLGAVRQSNVTLYSSVLGCSSSDGRWADTRTLWDWAYGTFEHRTLAGPSVLEASWTYPLRFGWDIGATAPKDVVGLVWPDGGLVDGQRVFEGDDLELKGGETVGVGRWIQDDRQVIACVFKANRLVRQDELPMDGRRLGPALHGIEV